MEKEISTTPISEMEIETDNYKCRSCGSNMVFDPESGNLKCPHCQSVVALTDTIHDGENDLIVDLGKLPQWDSETKVYKCENCGARVVLEKSETSSTCPFCSTAQVVCTEELPGIKPHAIIPYALSIQSAIEKVKAWAKKKLYAPKKFKKTITPDNMKGVYMPSFTFDSETSSVYQGRIGKTHTKTVGSGKNRRTQTYVVWRNISGTYDMFYDDVLITSGSKFAQKDLDKLAPYDTNASKKY